MTILPPLALRTLPRLTLLAVATAVIATACAHDAGEEDEAPAQPTISARTAVAAAQPFTESLSAIGSVVARAGHAATLGAAGPTRVVRVYVATGQRVRAGQPLVELEATAFEAAAQSADAALQAAQQAHDRQERLLREGVAPRKDVEQAAAELARTRADAVAARRQAQLAVLRAPIAGVITSMTATIGASVDAGQSLVELADPSALDIILNVTPTDAARVRPGARVALSASQRAGQSAAGEALGTGQVVGVAGAVDAASRSVAVRVRAPATARALRIGETVSGEIAVATRPGAITVPAEALVPDGEGFKVFVVDTGGIAHERPVTVGARAGAVVEITEGLAAGERVVTYGAYGVEDSAKIVPLAPAAKP